MDEAPTKWNVTVKKHLKQKRKVYRDGFLYLHASTAKNSGINMQIKLEGRFIQREIQFQTLEYLASKAQIPSGEFPRPCLYAMPIKNYLSSENH
ncbi:hypothetical protein BT93_E0787 [Corymbia citriodora subsp. variegata]|nr:hypothetical protein BT93_E0787 [Corymbia citriodora subsp. variegata]